MKLYYFETPNGRKPCAVAKYLKVPVDYVHVDLGKGENKKAEYLAINPNGKIPALEDGDFKLFESHSIMAYLAHKAKSDLWPSDPIEQVKILQWLNWDTAHFSRHGGRMLWENFMKPHFGLGQTNQAEVEDALGFFKQFAAVLNAHLKGRSTIVGNKLTIADFGVASFLPTAKQAKLPLAEFPEIERWHDGLMEIPAWQNPWPQRNTAAA